MRVSTSLACPHLGSVHSSRLLHYASILWCFALHGGCTAWGPGVCKLLNMSSVHCKATSCPVLMRERADLHDVLHPVFHNFKRVVHMVSLRTAAWLACSTAGDNGEPARGIQESADGGGGLAVH